MPRQKIKSIALFILFSPVFFTNATIAFASTILPALSAENTQANIESDGIHADIFYPRIEVVNTSCQAKQTVLERQQLLALQALRKFSSQVYNRVSKDIAGVFVDGVLAYPVIQQPTRSPAYVSAKRDVVTQFSLAEKQGSIGILAHNFLAGVSFFDLSYGQEIYVVYSDGRTVQYEVTDIRDFQALQPNSDYSEFIDLDTNAHYTASDVFYQIYGNDGNLVLQTCIANGGVGSWGRRFVIAEPAH